MWPQITTSEPPGHTRSFCFQSRRTINTGSQLLKMLTSARGQAWPRPLHSAARSAATTRPPTPLSFPNSRSAASKPHARSRDQPLAEEQAKAWPSSHHHALGPKGQESSAHKRAQGLSRHGLSVGFNPPHLPPPQHSCRGIQKVPPRSDTADP